MRRPVVPPPIEPSVADLAATKRRKLAAARKRRHRQRERRDEIVVPVAIGGDFISWAIDNGRIDEARAWDRSRLAGVLSTLVAEAMSRVPLDLADLGLEPVDTSDSASEPAKCSEGKCR